jgi:hypothetical protein
MPDESKNVGRRQYPESVRSVLATFPDETANNKLVAADGPTGKPALLR